MANENFIMVDLNDERSKHISEILGNKTCKKILEYLAGIERASENDIAKALKIPINTAEYNINKLVKAGLVEKTSNFFWSVKGKKIEMYKISNKKIIISPKKLVKGIIPSILGVVLGAVGIKLFFDGSNRNNLVQDNLINVANSAVQNTPAVDYGEKVMGVGVERAVDGFVNICPKLSCNEGVWFLFGGLIAVLIFLLWNQIKDMKGGRNEE